MPYKDIKSTCDIENILYYIALARRLRKENSCHT